MPVSIFDSVIQTLSRASKNTIRILKAHTDWQFSRLTQSIDVPHLAAVSIKFRYNARRVRVSAEDAFSSVATFLSSSCDTLEKLSISFTANRVDASGLYRHLGSICFRRLVDIAISTPFRDGIMSDNGTALTEFLRANGHQLKSLSLIPIWSMPNPSISLGVSYQANYLQCLTSLSQAFPSLCRLQMAAVNDLSNSGAERLEEVLVGYTKVINQSSSTLTDFAICDGYLDDAPRNLILDLLPKSLQPGHSHIRSLAINVDKVTRTLLDKLASEFSWLEYLSVHFKFLAPNDDYDNSFDKSLTKRIWLRGIPVWVKELNHSDQVLDISAQRFVFVMTGCYYSKWLVRRVSVHHQPMSTDAKNENHLEEILKGVLREAVPSLEWAQSPLPLLSDTSD